MKRGMGQRENCIKNGVKHVNLELLGFKVAPLAAVRCGKKGSQSGGG